MRRVTAILIGILALAGLADSTYLLLRHVGVLAAPSLVVASSCDFAGGACAVAASSKAGSIFGIPAPVFGALYFGSVAVMVVLRLHYGRWLLPPATLAFLIAGLLYSAYMTYLLFTAIGELCGYCLAAHAINLVVFLLFVLSLRSERAQAGSS